MAAKLPRTCEGLLDPEHGTFDPHLCLDLFAKALKYILPPRHWDFSGPLEYDGRVTRRNLQRHPNVQHIEKVFTDFRERSMTAVTAETICLKAIVSFDKGLGHRAKRRLRKKRVSDLQKRIKQQIREAAASSDHTLTQGVVLFGSTVKAQFLGK
jgi:hypothetical protein